MSRCPTREQLEQLLDECLGDAERRGVSAHVGECPACQAALEDLTAATEVSVGSLSGLTRPDAAGADPAQALPPFLTSLKKASVLSLVTAPPPGEAVVPPGPGGGPVVPGYEILGELGRGGMGVVYKARQVSLNRLVALKMILGGPQARPRDLARFRQEAEAVARLHHPNIVQIFDVGEAGGLAYFALEYVAYGSLAQRLRGDPQPLDPTVRLVETLAHAVHFAHENGIVHRDLKPANILLTGNREPGTGDREEPSGLFPVPCSLFPVPKITDFGLAKRLDDQASARHTGEIVGTPSYMAPEQAAGKARELGPACDVYALGAILYEMITGRPPFKGATPVDTVVQVLHEEPVRPGRLRPGLAHDLETICLKCLSKEPGRRYPSAAALADDLQRFRKGKPILARPVGPLERAWKGARRRPLTAALLAALVCSFVLGFAGVTWQWQEARRARDVALDEKRDKENERLQAEQARGQAVEERRRAQQALYYSRIAQGQLQWRVNNVPGAVQSLAKCVPAPGHEDRRGWEWHYLQGLFHSDLFTLHHSFDAAGGGAAFDPRGRTVVSVAGGHPTDDDGHPGEVQVWDAATGALRHTYRAPGTAHRLAFRPDGARLALATTDGHVHVWDAATGKELLRTAPHRQTVPGLAFSPDGRRLATASWDQTVKVADAATGEVVHVLEGHAARVQSVAFHPDGTKLATGDWEAAVKLWDARTGKELLTLTGHKSPVCGIAFSPDGALMATAGSNGNVRIWETAAGRVTQSLTARSGAVLGIAFSPDGRYLAYSGGDGTARVWDVESGVERVTFRGHTAPVESVHFSPDGQRLVSLSPQEGAARVWDLTRHPEHATFARVRGRAGEQVKVRDLTGRADAVVLARTGPDLEALAFHADGKHLVSVAVGGKLHLWDLASGMLKEQRAVPMCDELLSPAVVAAFAPGGTRLAARSREDPAVVKVWQVAGGAEVVALRGHTMPVLCVRFSADGTQLVTCACDTDRAGRPHEVKVWDAASGACRATRAGEGLLLNAVFRPDGRRLALGGQGGVVLLADPADLRRVARLPGHHGPVAALAFRPDGRMLASAGVDDPSLKLWELDDFDPAAGGKPPPAHAVEAPRFLCDLAFSPDGRRLAGISRDSLKMWDVATRHEVLSLRGAPQRYWDPAFNPRVAFSPDGNRLVGTNWDESISLWDAGDRGDEQSLARYQAARRQAADARAGYWHLEEAENCWEHRNRAAARFHFQRLGDGPLPPPLQARRDRLARELGD